MKHTLYQIALQTLFEMKQILFQYLRRTIIAPQISFMAAVATHGVSFPNQTLLVE
jgi:hypothetical protein